MFKKILAMSLLIMCLTQPVWAADVREAIGQVNNGLEKGDFGLVVDSLRLALEAAWNKGPLSVKNVTFVKEPPTGYGVYKPVEKNAFESIDPIFLYCEPIGYNIVKMGEEYRFGFSADFSMLDSEGNVLGGQKDFNKWSSSSRNFSMESMISFTFNLKGLPAGNYKLVVTLHDENSEKSVTFDKEFSIR